MTIGKKLYYGFGAVLVFLVALFLVNIIAGIKESSARKDASTPGGADRRPAAHHPEPPPQLSRPATGDRRMAVTPARSGRPWMAPRRPMIGSVAGMEDGTNLVGGVRSGTNGWRGSLCARRGEHE